MTDSAFAKERAFIDAAALEFRAIADALAKASCTSPIRDASTDKGSLLPVQVTACFRTLELDNLFGPAVQSAAAGSLKNLLPPLLKRMRKLQLDLRSKAIQAEDDGSTLPGSFTERYCGAVAELRSYIRASSPSSGQGQQVPTVAKKNRKQPSENAFKCYRLSLLYGGKQAVIAEMLSKELGIPVDQPKVSRWIKQVREWLEAGNVLPDLTANRGPKPKVVPMDPAKIDRGDGMKTATRPRRFNDDD